MNDFKIKKNDKNKNKKNTEIKKFRKIKNKFFRITYIFFLFISILYLTLYIPLSFLIYNPIWYQVNSIDNISNIDSNNIIFNNFKKFDNYNNYNENNLTNSNIKKITKNINSQIVGFFMHNNNLDKKIFSDSEIEHLSEVRIIYDKLFLIFLIIILVLIFTTIFFCNIDKIKNKIAKNNNKNKKYLMEKFLNFNFKKIVKRISVINIIFLASIGILILAFFNFFWNQIFHKILFRNNFWIYNSVDISAVIFPINLFINSSIFIFIVSIIINILIILFFKYRK